MEEIWKIIGDTTYSVSNLGNVKNHNTGRILYLAKMHNRGRTIDEIYDKLKR